MTHLEPPGQTETVIAASALVVAPHPDDEVLGCGGLLAQLARAGAAVRVLFLSDGGGGREEVADRDAYRRRRKEEAARAIEVLGLAGAEHLDLPDGALADHLDAIATGVHRALLSARPDLLLVPSPLEVSADHRAAFAAVHRWFAPLRDERDLAPFAGLRVLLYEINRPGFPDLLVDVSAEEALLERAMAAHASQEERHPYWNAALGLRRHRTLSLPAGVALAEGYRRLAVDDLRTRSLAQIVRAVGGQPDLVEVREGPRISVVVRTKDRPELLAEALASLAGQTYRKAEVVLVNDGGASPVVSVDFPLSVVRVDHAASRGRAAAAQAGIEAATGDAVAFLDDDDLAAPEHLATFAGLLGATGVRVAYTDAAVAVYELAGAERAEGGWICRSRALPYSRDFDPDLLLVDNYIPFNTVVVERALLREAGPLDLSLPFFEDWDLLIRLAALAPFHHLAQVTAEYRHFRGAPHHVFGERPRERADFLAVKERVIAKHAARLGPGAIARVVDGLRREAVEALQGAGHARAEAEGLRGEARDLAGRLAALGAEHAALSRERFDWEERYHAANGRIAALEDEREVARRELERLYEDERALRATVDDQSAHLGRTYGEIERLNRLVRAMESTRAWRLHRRLHRLLTRSGGAGE